MNAVIDVENVYKSYGAQQVLRGVSFQVQEGERVALMGPSGCGKSTLLHVVGGLDRDYKGHIAVYGRTLETSSDREISQLRNEKIGFVFQFFHLVDHLSCLENIVLGNAFAAEPLSPKQAEQRAKELLRKVGLPEVLHRRPTELSGGQKQRVAIARALLLSPRLLLCDEPTGNLDKDTAGSIIDLFLQLNQEGLTLLWVTHDSGLKKVATRVIQLQDGVIVP